MTPLLAFGGWPAEEERAKQVVRGQSGDEITAMGYGELFPNPGPIAGLAP